MSLFSIAFEKLPNLTAASKFTAFNGFVYLGLGVLLILWPGAIQTLLGERAFVGDEQSLFRVLGLAVGVIGYYLVIGGRSGGRPASAASVIDRLTVAPLVLIPLAIAGVFPRFLIAVVVVDATLAISTWALLRRADAASPPVPTAGRAA